MKKIAILQPNYIPWKGVFDLISRVDVFVFYDDVQYTTKDWRNRNRIKTPNGEIWLTVPVLTKGLREQLICEARINTATNWQEKHFKALRSSYQKAPFFKDYEYLLEDLYLKQQWTKISDLDIYSTKLLAKTLGIDVQWHNSSDLQQTGSKDGEKVVKICKLLECDYFINGPSARGFMNEALFKESGIVLDYMKYNYPVYPQLHGPFTHHVSVLDVIFNCGPKARDMIFMHISES